MMLDDDDDDDDDDDVRILEKYIDLSFSSFPAGGEPASTIRIHRSFHRHAWLGEPCCGPEAHGLPGLCGLIQIWW